MSYRVIFMKKMIPILIYKVAREILSDAVSVSKFLREIKH